MTVFRKEYYSPDLLDDSIKMRNAGDWLFWIKITAKGDIIEVYEKLNLFRLHRKSATVAGIMSGNNVWEDIKVMKYVEDHFNVGKYRKAMRLANINCTLHITFAIKSHPSAVGFGTLFIPFIDISLP